MRASRKARLDKMWAAHREAEAEARSERAMLRFYRDICPLVRRAMLLAGIDPASARALREVEKKLAGFVDTPELQRADEEFDDAERAEERPLLIDGIDAHEALLARLDDTGRRYKESGTEPNLWFASFMELLGWSTIYDDIEDEAAEEGEESPSPPFRGEREGPTAKRWEGEVGLSAIAPESPTSPRPSPPPGAERESDGAGDVPG